MRQALRRALEQDRFTARELSAELGVPEKDVAHHLEHLQRSLARERRRLAVEPAECLACGYRFTRRRRLTRPTSCPECRATRIAPPAFSVEADR